MVNSYLSIDELREVHTYNTYEIKASLERFKRLAEDEEAQEKRPEQTTIVRGRCETPPKSVNAPRLFGFDVPTLIYR